MTFKSKRPAILALILIITFAAKSPVIFNGFINRDDPAYITENPIIRDFSAAGIGRIFSTPEYMADYHPLTLTLFSLEYHFFGDDALGYHVVSLLLHLMITALVFLVVLRLSEQTSIAAIASTLFGVHPANVESVAWASEQKDLLYGLLYLISLLSYILYVRNNQSTKQYIISLVSFVLAMLAKMMAAPLAIVLFLVDYLVHREFTWKTLIEKLPFIAAALFLGGLEMNAHKEIGAMLNDISYGALGRSVLASYATLGYIGKLVAPLNLSAYYPFPFPPGSMPAPYAFYGIFVLIGIVLCILTARRTRTVLFGFGFFLLNVAVILQIVPAVGAFMADRYTYIASIGLCYLAAVGIVHLKSLRAAWRTPVWVAFAAYVIVLSASSWNRCYVWRDGLTLWDDVLGKYPDVAFMYVYRANARKLPEQSAPALADIDRAIQLQPDLGIAFYSRAYITSTLGNQPATIEGYTRAIDLHYQPVKSYTNRGSAQTAAGKYREAIADYSSALRLDPAYFDAYFNRANVYAALGDYKSAIADYDNAIGLNPQDGETYYNRGISHARAGNPSAACADLARAESLSFVPAAAARKEYCR